MIPWLRRIWTKLKAPELDPYEKQRVGSTEHYKWHGLTRAYMGSLVLFVVATGAFSEAVMERGASLLLLALGGVVVIQAVYWMAGYDTPNSGLRHRHRGLLKANLRDLPNAAVGGAALLLWFAVGVFCGTVDLVHQWPVSLMGLWFAAGVLIAHIALGTYQENFGGRAVKERLKRVKVSSHYLVMSVLVFLSTLAPLTGLVGSHQLYANGQFFGTVFGIVLIVGGLLDHRLLRNLEPADPPDPHEGMGIQ